MVPCATVGQREPLQSRGGRSAVAPAWEGLLLLWVQMNFTFPLEKGSGSLHLCKTATDMIPLYKFNSRMSQWQVDHPVPEMGATILAKLLYVSDAFITLSVLLKPATCPVQVPTRNFWSLILRKMCSVDYSL